MSGKAVNPKSCHSFFIKLCEHPGLRAENKEQPESGKEVAIVFFIYLGSQILLSVLFNAIDFLPRSGLWGFPKNVFPFV